MTTQTINQLLELADNNRYTINKYKNIIAHLEVENVLIDQEVKYHEQSTYYERDYR